MDLVETHDLCKNYGKKIALNNLNVSIEKGKIIGLLGKNGSGKSTFMKVINDLLTPTSGSILVNGQKPGVNSKKIISYLPEKTYLDSSFTIKDSVNMFKAFYEDFNEKTAYKLLKDLDLDKTQKINKLSKGMQEKLQLILVMSRKAELYVLDEPLSGVDPATRDYILDTILTHRNTGSTILISTHLISDIERILDEVILIDDGKLIEHKSTSEIKKKEKCTIDEYFRRLFKC